jgi:hypothetical protein
MRNRRKELIKKKWAGIDGLVSGAVPTVPVASSVSVSESVGVYSLSYTYDFGIDESNKVPYGEDVTITGTLQVGSVLTATLNEFKSFNDKAAGTHDYQWYRSNNIFQDGEVAISGATSSTYTLVAADDSKYIRCEVTPVESGGVNKGIVVTSTYTTTTITTASVPSIESRTVTIKGDSATSITFNMPRTRPDGDLYVVFIAKDDDQTFTLTGWTELQSGSGASGTELRLKAYYRVGAGGEPATYETGTSDSETWIATVYRISGQHGTPIDISAVVNEGVTLAPTAPDVTTTAANCRVLTVSAGNDNLGLPTGHVYTATPVTEDFKHQSYEEGVSGAIAMAGSNKIQVSAGATGVATFAFNGNTALEEHVGITVAIAPV